MIDGRVDLLDNPRSEPFRIDSGHRRRVSWNPKPIEPGVRSLRDTAVIRRTTRSHTATVV